MFGRSAMSGNSPTAPPALRGRPSTYRYHNPHSRQTSTSLPPLARTSSQEPGVTQADEPLVTTTQTQGSTSQHQEQCRAISTRSDQQTSLVSENSTHSSQRLLPFKFYITRESGAKVPLIAVDELPLKYQIVGAPRVLPSNVAESHDLIYAGHASHRDQFHEVRQIDNIRREPRGPKFPGRQEGAISSQKASNPIGQPFGSPPGPPEKRNLPRKAPGAPYIVHPLPPTPATGGPSPRRFIPRNAPHTAHPLPPNDFQPQNAPPGSQPHNRPHPPYLQPSRPPGQYSTFAEHTMPPYQTFPLQPFPPPGSFPMGALTGYMTSPPPPVPGQYGALPNYMVSSPPPPPMGNSNDQADPPDQYIPSSLQPRPSDPGSSLPLGYPNVYPWSNSTSDHFGGR
jgi:hypothetical protein